MDHFLLAFVVALLVGSIRLDRLIVGSPCVRYRVLSHQIVFCGGEEVVWVGATAYLLHVPDLLILTLHKLRSVNIKPGGGCLVRNSSRLVVIRNNAFGFGLIQGKRHVQIGRRFRLLRTFTTTVALGLHLTVVGQLFNLV